MKLKYSTFLVLAVGMMCSAHAQTTKGNLLLGASVGNLSYSRASEDYTHFSANATTSAARFVADKLAFGTGLGFGYDHRKTRSDATAETVTTRMASYSIAPFARCYAWENGRHWVFGQLGFKYTRLTSRTTFEFSHRNNRSAKDEFESLEVAVGYNYFINSSVALEALAGYSRGSISAFGAESAAIFRLGLSVFLPGRADAASVE